MKIFASIIIRIVSFVFVININGLFVTYSQIQIENFDQKQQLLNQIRDKIWKTIDIPFQKPNTVLIHVNLPCNNFDSLAFYNIPTQTIYISEELYDDLNKLNKIDFESELAVFIGHEMGHYFNNHLDRNVTLAGYYITSQEIEVIENSVEKHDKSCELESQADIFAARHLFAAGYDVEKYLPEALDFISQKLKKCNIALSLKYYLPITDRKKITANVLKEMKRLSPLFKLSKYVSIIGDYEFSAKCLEYISRTYKSWEIYNNIGVNYALEALKYLPRKKIRFIYPFEFEANSSLNTSAEITSKSLLTNIDSARES
jgi:hypothetical protein